jgi:hypothetical protein
MLHFIAKGLVSPYFTRARRFSAQDTACNDFDTRPTGISRLCLMARACADQIASGMLALRGNNSRSKKITGKINLRGDFV